MTYVNTTLKLDSRVRYFAQLVARSHGITFGDLVDSLLAECLASAVLTEGDRVIAGSELMDQTWASHAADRLALIGNRFPELLTDRERVMWQRIVCESQCFWHVELTGDVIPVCDETFNFELWREAMAIYADMTRDEMLVEANRFRKARASIPNWYSNAASIEMIRKREEKFASHSASSNGKEGM